MDHPLGDLRVVDASSGIAGGFCSKLLAQYGATVVKVEPLLGDPLRSAGPFLDDEPGPERSLLFNWLHSGKQSVALDLESAEGVRSLRRLLAGADVLLDSAPPGGMRSRGLDQASLEASLPRLVCTSITAFGQDGPYAGYEATFGVLQALGGWVHAMGERERPPVITGSALGLFMTGVCGAVGTMAALEAVDEVGGQAVEVAAQEAIAAAAMFDTVRFQYTGVERERAGRSFSSLVPLVGIQPARDGWCGVHVLLSWHLGRLFEAMDRPELRDDPRFRTPEEREANAEALDALVGGWTRSQDAVSFYHASQGRGLPFNFVPTAAQVYASPQLEARDYWDALPVGERTVRVPGLPFRLAGSLEGGRGLTPAPALGEHTRAVLAAAGIAEGASGESPEARDG